MKKRFCIQVPEVAESMAWISCDWDGLHGDKHRANRLSDVDIVLIRKTV